MAQHNQLGKTGEERAAEYLISKGYIIRDINWRSGKMELDIVAYRDKTLVVVEVKTRKNNEFLRPEEAVTFRKIKNIIQATDAYIRMFDIPFDIRFDIITLVGENEDFQIEHIEDVGRRETNFAQMRSRTCHRVTGTISRNRTGIPHE